MSDLDMFSVDNPRDDSADDHIDEDVALGGLIRYEPPLPAKPQSRRGVVDKLTSSAQNTIAGARVADVAFRAIRPRIVQAKLEEIRARWRDRKP